MARVVVLSTLRTSNEDDEGLPFARASTTPRRCGSWPLADVPDSRPQARVTAVRSSTTPGRRDSGLVSKVFTYGGKFGRAIAEGMIGEGGNSKVGRLLVDDSFFICKSAPPMAGTRPLCSLFKGLERDLELKSEYSGAIQDSLFLCDDTGLCKIML